MYIIPLTTARTSTVRLLPPFFAGGMIGPIRPTPRRSGRSGSAACFGHTEVGSPASTSRHSCESLQHKRITGDSSDSRCSRIDTYRFRLPKNGFSRYTIWNSHREVSVKYRVNWRIAEDKWLPV